MLKVVLKHYILDRSIEVLFDRISTNFSCVSAPVNEFYAFPEMYSGYIGSDVRVWITPNCVYDRNLPIDYITGVLSIIREDSIGINMSDDTAKKLGWNGKIYLYEADIYKLYT